MSGVAFLPSRRSRRNLRALASRLTWLARSRPTPTPTPSPTLTALGLRRRRAPAGHIIALSGELNLDTRESLIEALEQALDDDVGQIVLDLSALASIDGAGLDTILTAHLRASDELTTMVIIPGPETVQRVFDAIQGPFVYALRYPRRGRSDRPGAHRTLQTVARSHGPPRLR
ncbi:MAG: hypothetical protein QOJ25_1597 [Solirubrobacteraceae bacterium]|nr:hypothetical protein [Solirubrobacteraceae bacterium]